MIENEIVDYLTCYTNRECTQIMLCINCKYSYSNVPINEYSYDGTQAVYAYANCPCCSDSLSFRLDGLYYMCVITKDYTIYI